MELFHVLALALKQEMVMNHLGSQLLVLDLPSFVVFASFLAFGRLERRQPFLRRVQCQSLIPGGLDHCDLGFFKKRTHGADYFTK